MFGVLSGLLKAKEHMRIESSEVTTVELKPYKSETETCVITLNNGEQVVLKLPDYEGNTRSIQIALNRNFLNYQPTDPDRLQGFVRLPIQLLKSV